MSLFSKYRLGNLELTNRIVMAPMTRSRALPGNVPGPLTVDYYRQRASAGLIITEATQISPQGVGYVRTPGIHSPEQVSAWRKVTEAVHREGGRIFVQLWHVGRISHPDFHAGEPPVAPSAIAAEGATYTPSGKKAFVTPRALEREEIPGIVEQYRRAALNAIEAGFDGVEIHGANGYLIDQFLKDGSNRRTDEYGGSVENRARFALEVTRAVTGTVGPERVGFRVSPLGTYNSMSDSDPVATFSYLARELRRLKIAYLHVIEGPQAEITPVLRELFGGTLIAAQDFEKDSAEQVIASGLADLVAFGTAFIANPDLPGRLKAGAPLNEPDFATFYTGEEKGYTDYPVLEAAGG